MLYAYELTYIPIERDGISTETLEDWLARIDGALMDLARGRRPRVNELRRTLRDERRNVAGELVARFAAEAPPVDEAARKARAKAYWT